MNDNYRNDYKCYLTFCYLKSVYLHAKVLHEHALKSDFASCRNFVASVTPPLRKKNQVYELVLFSFSAHENNFHCLAKAIDRISVALCSNNGDNMEVRLRELLVVSESNRT